MPARAYTDDAWLAEETERLFERTWTLVATTAELAASGACVPVTVGRYPLVVVRQPDGSLRGFHNMCSHRGMALVAELRNDGDRLLCPYHGWRYGLDGDVDVIPQRSSQFIDVDPASCGLRHASVDTWEGMVFVHPDADAAPLADTLGALSERIGSFQPARLTELGHTTLEGNFNWKLFVENHVDVLHLWYLHDISLGSFDHTSFEHQSFGPDGANWASYEPLKPASARAGVPLDQGTVPIRHIDQRDRHGIGAHMVFPNLLMASASEFFATYAVYPVTPSRSRVDLRVFGEPDADADVLLAATQSFINEDIVACEGIQTAVSSSHFAVGALAIDHERPITEFQHHLLAALGKTA